MSEFDEFNDQEKNLTLVIEECAEVIQTICKIKRFGINDVNPTLDITNQNHLSEEVGQLLYCLDILGYYKVLNQEKVSEGYREKAVKLSKWYHKDTK